MTWTDERIAELKRLYALEKTFVEIGRLMHLPTNSVLGKAHRLGIIDPKISAQNVATGSKTGGKITCQIVKARNSKPKTPTDGKVFQFGFGMVAVKDPKPVVIRSTDIAAPGALMIPMAAPDFDGCRWPIGEGDAMVFCCADRNEGATYCATHARVANYKTPITGRGSFRELERVVLKLAAGSGRR